MNNIPLLKSKLTVPEIPKRVLYCKRIKDLNIQGKRAVVITAPAGFGKTTAVLLSLKNKQSSIHWYRMEKEDSFLPVFYAHLIETLFGWVPLRSVREETAPAAESIRSLMSIGKISDDYPLLNAIICQDAWTAYANFQENTYIVFDDFHNVAHNTAIVETVRYFITNMPPNFRIIVVSRTETGVPTIGQAIKANIGLIGEEALRFTKDEIGDLMSKVYRINPDNDSLNRIYALTEGWITGVAMLGSAEPMSQNPIMHSSFSGDRQQAIFKLFLNEVLGASNEKMLKVLAQISILPDFNEDCLKAIFGMEDAAGAVSWLEKSNICLQKLNSNGLSYRFHSLLQNALLSFLNELFSKDEIEEMNLKAACYYKKLGASHMAISFLIAAGRIDEAVRMASDDGMRLMNAGDTEKIISLIQDFPEDRIQSDPYLMLFRGASLMNSDYEESYSYLFRALTVFRRKKNTDLQMNVVSLIISMCYKRNDMAYIKNISSLIPIFKALTKSGYGRKTLFLCAFMGFAWADRLSLADILRMLVTRYQFSELLLSYMLDMTKVGLLFRKGRLDEAERIIKPLSSHQMTITSDRWRVLLLALHHNVASHKGDIKTSEKITSELASIGEKYGSEYARYHAIRLSAYNRYQTRDIKGATGLAESSANLFAEYGNQVIASAMRATLYLWKSENEPAAVLAEKADAELANISSLKTGQGFLELCQTIAGALHKEAGDYNKSEKLLLKAYRASRGKRADLSAAGTAMQLADLYYRKRNRKLEERFLRIWAEISEKRDYTYFREMTYPVLVRVCARCVENGISTEYVKRIVEKYFGPGSAESMAENPAQPSASPGDFISERVTVKHGKSIRIKLLGRFRMSVDGVEIGEKEWKTRKIAGILKYILANPDKTVSRETLAALLWPESDSKSAFTSLRAALYELRKILARFGVSFESDDSLIVESRNGFHLNRKSDLATDAQEMLQLYGQYKSGGLPADGSKGILEEAVGLYSGDFLEEDAYDDWVTMSREHYKSVFVECSHSLARLLLAGGEYDRAEAVLEKHLRIDPYDEKACGMLIGLYNDTGRNSQAASLKRQFGKRFELEMGVRPELR